MPHTSHLASRLALISCCFFDAQRLCIIIKAVFKFKNLPRFKVKLRIHYNPWPEFWTVTSNFLQQPVISFSASLSSLIRVSFLVQKKVEIKVKSVPNHHTSFQSYLKANIYTQANQTYHHPLSLLSAKRTLGGWWPVSRHEEGHLGSLGNCRQRDWATQTNYSSAATSTTEVNYLSLSDRLPPLFQAQMPRSSQILQISCLTVDILNVNGLESAQADEKMGGVF